MGADRGEDGPANPPLEGCLPPYLSGFDDPHPEEEGAIDDEVPLQP